MELFAILFSIHAQHCIVYWRCSNEFLYHTCNKFFVGRDGKMGINQTKIASQITFVSNCFWLVHTVISWYCTKIRCPPSISCNRYDSLCTFFIFWFLLLVLCIVYLRERKKKKIQFQNLFIFFDSLCVEKSLSC